MDVELAVKNGLVKGHCVPEFQPVLDEFVRNFNERDELGASLCVSVAGETLIDVWGGVKSPAKNADLWEADTVSVIFSCTKAAVALCANMLIDQGKMDLHAPVAQYWPEFASNGKEKATVEMMLNHSVGLPAFREPLREGGYCDWDYMIDRMAKEAPFWEPGTRHGYHMGTFGWTVGELVKRVSGQSLGTYFRENIADPLGLDFWIGLPDSEHKRVSRILRWKPVKGSKPAPFTDALLKDPNSLQYLALLNNGRFRTDSPESYRAEYGAGGGIANGRALAGMYIPLANGGDYNGIRLVSSDHIERMSATSTATLEDATLLMPSQFGLGFMRSMDNRHRESGGMETMILGKNGFGHAGAGGNIGFADTDANLAMGYTMNRMGAGILLNERGQSLVDVVYKNLGYRTNDPGFWIK